MNPLLQALSAVGYALDTPGAYLRGALGGELGSRMSGRDLLENWGAIGENQEGLDAGDVAGFAVDAVVDPLALLGPAFGAFKAGKAAGKYVDDAARIMPDNMFPPSFSADEIAEAYGKTVGQYNPSELNGLTYADVGTDAFTAADNYVSGLGPNQPLRNLMGGRGGKTLPEMQEYLASGRAVRDAAGDMDIEPLLMGGSADDFFGLSDEAQSLIDTGVFGGRTPNKFDFYEYGELDKALLPVTKDGVVYRGVDPQAYASAIAKGDPGFLSTAIAPTHEKYLNPNNVAMDLIVPSGSRGRYLNDMAKGAPTSDPFAKAYQALLDSDKELLLEPGGRFVELASKSVPSIQNPLHEELKKLVMFMPPGM